MTVSEMIAPATQNTVALSLDRITKTFPGVRALDQVELSVAYGEVHGVVGENGAGKSTLMAIASGALRADEGSIHVGGRELTSASPDAARNLGIAIVRQEPALMPDLTVAENLYLAVGGAHRPSAASILPWATRALEVWGPDVTVRASDRVEQLNPQQRFIVEICRALAQDPDVLILDEPTEHLLRDEVEILFGHIRSHVERGKAVIYISHRIPEVKAIADRITVLRNGRTEGTHDASVLTEDQIVKLIIGRELDVFFPDKHDGEFPDGGGLSLEGFSARDVADLTMTFHAGEIVGLAGIEGNGQRALLRALAGLEPSSGDVTIGGRTLGRHSQRNAVRHRVSFLSGDRHNEGVLTGLDVGENIVYRSLDRVARGGWVGNGSLRALGAQVVQAFNVKTPSLETPIESLSGGNQQKALVGSVLVNAPKVFLVDEPTQGVDVGAKSEIYDLVRRAADDGAVVIVLSSSALELAGLADRVLVFSRGHVIRELTGDDLSEEAITATVLTADTERTRTSRSRHRVIEWLASDIAPVAVVGALIVALLLVGFLGNPLFLGPRNIAGVLALTVPLALVAFGQLFVLLTGGIDLSTGPLMGLVAIIGSFYLIDGSPLVSQATGWLFIIGVAIAIGLINWTLVDLVKLSPIIATLVTYMAVQAISFILRPTSGGSISSAVTGPIKFTIGPIPVAFIVVVALAIGLNIWLKRSRGGIAIRAVGSRVESARVNGLRPKYVRLLAYLACSLFAGFAGIAFMAQIGTGDAGAGVNYTLIGITAAVVGGASVFGGRGSFLGALLGAVMVQIVNAITVFLKLTPDWQYYLVGLMTLGAVALYSVARRRAAARH